MGKKSSASSRPEKRRRLKSESISLDEATRAAVEELENRPVNLTDPDAPEIESWMVRERGELYRPLKQQITLRLDKDIILWFKAGGTGYQTRVNDALREHIRSRLNRTDP